MDEFSCINMNININFNINKYKYLKLFVEILLSACIYVQTCVLVLSETELVSSQYYVLCFGLSMRMMLVTH